MLSDVLGVIVAVVILIATAAIALYLAHRVPVYLFRPMMARDQTSLKNLTKRLLPAMLATAFGMAALVVVGVPIVLVVAMFGVIIILTAVSVMIVVVLGNR